MNIPTREELNALRDECYKISCDHGFHDEPYTVETRLCLVITELMEAVEADRRDRYANLQAFNESLNSYTCVESFEGYIKDTVEDELADAFIRILDFAGVEKYDIGGAFEKMMDGKKIIYIRQPLPDFIYGIVRCLVFSCMEKPYQIENTIRDLLACAKMLGFDLMEHIRLKMEYNRTRERLHGKKY